jgi:HK97 family phage portal protein
MGILNGLGWTGQKPTEEKRELTYVSCNASGALPFFSGNNQYSAMNLSAVYRAVELISNSIASLPIKILIQDESGKNEADKHPLNYVFSDRNTNNLISRFTLMKLLVQSVLLRGNGFALIERANGNVKALRYLEPNDVNIVFDKIKNKLYYDIPMLKQRIEPKEMIHLVMFSYDGIKGLSVLQNAARSLGIAHSSENAAKSFFDNGMMINGILKVQGPVNQKQREDLRSAWNETYTANGSGIAILQGNMDYQSVQLSAKESQMLESRQFSVTDIARFFGINPVLLGDLSKVSFNTLEAVQNEFLVHTLQPYISMIENEFDRKLLRQSEDNLSITLETNEILRTDKAAQSNYYSTLINSGVLSINEVRKELGYNGIGEDGDKHYLLFNDASKASINNDENNKNKEDEE